MGKPHGCRLGMLNSACITGGESTCGEHHRDQVQCQAYMGGGYGACMQGHRDQVQSQTLIGDGDELGVRVRVKVNG